MSSRGVNPLFPVIEFLIDLAASGLGGSGRKPRAPFPEGAGNASLGAVAAVGFGSRWAGVRAPAVTRRNLGLAMLGRIVATAAVYMSIVLHRLSSQAITSYVAWLWADRPDRLGLARAVGNGYR